MRGFGYEPVDFGGGLMGAWVFSDGDSSAERKKLGFAAAPHIREAAKAGKRVIYARFVDHGRTIGFKWAVE